MVVILDRGQHFLGMNSTFCVPWDESKPVAMVTVVLLLCYNAINEHTVTIDITICWFW